MWDIDFADFVGLHFNDQKNAVKNEMMGHRQSYDGVADPVCIIGEWVEYLWQHGAHADTPLSAVFKGGRWSPVRSKEITQALRVATTAIGHRHGISPTNILTWSMQTGGR